MCAPFLFSLSVNIKPDMATKEIAEMIFVKIVEYKTSSFCCQKLPQIVDPIPSRMSAVRCFWSFTVEA
jgi:hypothetical protein